MKLTKEMVREAWEKEPAFLSVKAPGNQAGARHCAVVAVHAHTGQNFPDDLRNELIRLNDYGFSHEDGVTPEERKACMIAMLDAGAFDFWLDSTGTA